MLAYFWISVLLSAPTGSALLEKAKAFYADLAYEECLRASSAASELTLSKTERADLYLTQGLCEIQLRQLDEATASFTRALQLNTDAALPRYAPPSARERFSLALQALQQRTGQSSAALPPEKLEGAPTAEQQPAPRASETEIAQVREPRPRTYQPWVARAALGALCVGGLATGVGLLVSAHDMAARARNEPFQSTHLELSGQATTLQTWSVVSGSLALSLALALILHEVWFRWSP